MQNVKLKRDALVWLLRSNFTKLLIGLIITIVGGIVVSIYNSEYLEERISPKIQKVAYDTVYLNALLIAVNKFSKYLKSTVTTNSNPLIVDYTSTFNLKKRITLTSYETISDHIYSCKVVFRFMYSERYSNLPYKIVLRDGIIDQENLSFDLGQVLTEFERVGIKIVKETHFFIPNEGVEVRIAYKEYEENFVGRSYMSPKNTINNSLQSIR